MNQKDRFAVAKATRSFFFGKSTQLTAGYQCAQEKPPEDPHEAGDGASMTSSPDEDRDENVDNNLSVFFSPQEGHGAWSSSLLNCRYSKILVHFLHLYSYMGIDALLIILA